MQGLHVSRRKRAVNAPGGCSGVPLLGSGTLLAVLSGSRSMLVNATASSTRASAGTRAAFRLTSASSRRTGSCFSQNSGSLSPALTNFPLLACTARGTQAAQRNVLGHSLSTKLTGKTAHLIFRTQVWTSMGPQAESCMNTDQPGWSWRTCSHNC